jgi:SAM-dependent methyltransferase
VYALFAEQITRSGRILDLGCGNGLLLKYVVSRSPHTLIPYGVDLMRQSIAQARQIVLPEFARNFSVGNVAEYVFADAPYEYIFIGPDDVYPQDLELIVGAVTRACAVGGRVIFYCYRDVLNSQDLSWVGEIAPLSRLGLRRVDRPEVSLGVFEKSDDRNA